MRELKVFKQATYSEAMETIKSHQTSPPVQTVPIANELGLHVYKVTGWPDNLSGKIERDDDRGGNSGYAIYVNADHIVFRRRFTIAHEIAHFVLHRDEIGDGVFDDALYRSGLSSRSEAQANRLAADILMPWPLINEAIRRGLDTVSALAQRFNVSNSAMSIRLGVPFESK